VTASSNTRKTNVLPQIPNTKAKPTNIGYGQKLAPIKEGKVSPGDDNELPQTQGESSSIEGFCKRATEDPSNCKIPQTTSSPQKQSNIMIRSQAGE